MTMYLPVTGIKKVLFLWTHLSSGIKKLINTDFNLVKEAWVQCWIQLMSNQFLHMLLDGGPKLFILKYQQLQQVANKPAHIGFQGNSACLKGRQKAGLQTVLSNMSLFFTSFFKITKIKKKERKESEKNVILTSFSQIRTNLHTHIYA